MDMSLAVNIIAHDRFTRNMTKMTRSLGTFSGRLSRVSKKMRALGAKTSMVGAGMAAGLALALKPAIEFEEKMSEVRKVVNFDTPKQFQAMKDTVLNMATRLPMVSGQIADIMSAFGQAGFKRSALPHMTETAIKMGIAFDMAGEEAGGAMSGLMTQFNLTEKGVIDLGDTFNYLSNNMDATAKGIMDYSGRTAGLARTWGLTAKNNAALGATFLALKVPPETAARAMKTLGLALINGDKGTKKFKAGMKSLGLDAVKFAVLMKQHPQKAFEEFIKAAHKSKNTKTALVDIVGLNFVAPWASLVASADKYQKAVKLANSKQASGSMNAEYLAKSKTTASQLTLLKNQVNKFWVDMGSLILPVVSKWAKSLQKVVKQFTLWAKAHPKLFKVALVIAMIATALVTVAGPLLIFISLFGTLNAVLLANPIIAIIAGIALAVYLIYDNWDAIVAYFKNIWESVKKIFGGAGDIITGLWNGDMARVKKGWQDMCDGITDYANALTGNVFKGWATGMDEWTKSNQKAVDAVTKHVDALGRLGDTGEKSLNIIRKMTKAQQDAKLLEATQAHTQAKINQDNFYKKARQSSNGFLGMDASVPVTNLIDARAKGSISSPKFAAVITAMAALEKQRGRGWFGGRFDNRNNMRNYSIDSARRILKGLGQQKKSNKNYNKSGSIMRNISLVQLQQGLAKSPLYNQGQKFMKSGKATSLRATLKQLFQNPNLRAQQPIPKKVMGTISKSPTVRNTTQNVNVGPTTINITTTSSNAQNIGDIVKKTIAGHAGEIAKQVKVHNEIEGRGAF